MKARTHNTAAEQHAARRAREARKHTLTAWVAVALAFYVLHKQAPYLYAIICASLVMIAVAQIVRLLARLRAHIAADIQAMHAEEQAKILNVHPDKFTAAIDALKPEDAAKVRRVFTSGRWSN